MKVRITFSEEALGLSPSNPDIYREFVADNAPDAPSIEEEVEALGVEEVIEKARTVFPRVDGVPIIWDYQMKGFFKDACGMLFRAAGTKSSQLTAYLKTIDGLVFVYPRTIKLIIPEGGKIGECQRPLRARTMQGDRVALANSETVPIGTSAEFEIEMFELKKGKVKLVDCIVEWLDYGKKRGFSQWRNSGKGRFTWERLDGEKK